MPGYYTVGLSIASTMLMLVDAYDDFPALAEAYPVGAFFFYWSYAFFILYFTLNVVIGVISLAFEQARTQQNALIGDASWSTLCLESWASFRARAAALVRALERLAPRRRQRADHEVLHRWKDQWHDGGRTSPLNGRESPDAQCHDEDGLVGLEDGPRPSADPEHSPSGDARDALWQPPRYGEAPRWYWFTVGGHIYGNAHATLCRKLEFAPATLTYRQLEALLDRGKPRVNAPYHTASVLYTMVQCHTDRVYLEYKAALRADGRRRDGNGDAGEARDVATALEQLDDKVARLDDKVAGLQLSVQTLECSLSMQLQAMRDEMRYALQPLGACRLPVPNPVVLDDDAVTVPSRAASSRASVFQDLHQEEKGWGAGAGIGQSEGAETTKGWGL